MSRKVKITIVSVVLFLLLGGSLWAWYANYEDPAITNVKALQAALINAPDDQPVEEQIEAMRKVREATHELTDEQRKALGEKGGRGYMFEAAMKKRASAFAKTPADERTAFLDRDIDRAAAFMQAMWADRAKRSRREGEGRRGGPNGGPGGGNGPGGRDGNGGNGGQGKNGSGNSVAGDKGPGNGGPGNGGPGSGGPGQGGPGPGGPTSRDDRKRIYLDSTTPIERAELYQYRLAMQQRLQDRGIPSGFGFGGGRGPR